MPQQGDPREKSRSNVRINNAIKARRIRAVDDEGKHIGILPIEDALRMAEAKGLDLVEVASDADPPVCRIMDFGKYRYDQTKKEKVSRRHQQTAKVKEIRLHPTIDSHDLSIKENKARDFLQDGHKVKISVRFKGRQNDHPEYGFEILNGLVEKLQDAGAVEVKPKLFGNTMSLMLGPIKSR